MLYNYSNFEIKNNRLTERAPPVGIPIRLLYQYFPNLAKDESRLRLKRFISHSSSIALSRASLTKSGVRLSYRAAKSQENPKMGLSNFFFFFFLP